MTDERLNDCFAVPYLPRLSPSPSELAYPRVSRSCPVHNELYYTLKVFGEARSETLYIFFG